MSERQLDLLEWRPPAEVIAFPFHRSHGATVVAARALVEMDTAKRTGRLNSIRTKTRKQMEALFGTDHAAKIADDLVRIVRVQLAYQSSLENPIKSSGSVVSMPRRHIETFPSSDGEAGALGQGDHPLAGLGGAHDTVEYDAERAREGGAA